MNAPYMQQLKLFALVLVLGLSGCQKSAPKLALVSGTVTLDQQPLSEGTIYFKTVATGATETIAIKDGKFEGTVEPGERRVEITAFKVKKGDFNGMKGEVKENLLSDRYNLKSKLSATVQPTGPNSVTFDLKSK